jgi:thiol-disulfide isomerase/thioredoxin
MSSAVPVVTLYGRPECHLCDDARAAILALADEDNRVEIREINIDDDDELLARYLERIPVVELDGEVISELEFDRHDLITALDAAERGLHTVEP